MERITSTQNPKIKHAARLLSSSRERRKEGLFVLEGLRLCMDIVRSGLTAEELYVTDDLYEKERDQIDRLASVTKQVFLIDEKVSRKLTDTRTPQGICCVLRTLDKQGDRNKIEKMDAAGRYILLENVQDPANLGAVSRTAEALGLTGMIVSGGCDIYSPKALRASMGALLRLPVLETGDIQKTILQANQNGMKTYASVPSADAEKITGVEFHDGTICVIGNEANGVTDETLAHCQEKITIPMAGRAESLNAGAAASIIMWEMVRPYDNSTKDNTN